MKNRGLFYYFIVMVMNYYIVPLMIQNTGGGMVALLLLEPAICFFASFLLCRKRYSYFVAGTLAVVLFIPSIFLFYNASAWIYALLYGIISWLGACLAKVDRSSKYLKVKLMFAPPTANVVYQSMKDSADELETTINYACEQKRIDKANGV